MIPNLGGYRPSGVPFQGRKVFMQESHGLFALGTAFLTLDMIEDSMRLHRLHVDSRWLVVFVATALPFFLAIITKRASRRASKI
jgi:hypothetical protein